MPPIIITTTNAIDGYHIEQYLDVVRCNIVLNREMALFDLFNGATIKYRNQLNDIYSNALQQLRLKGISLGADAIVGLQSDFEELSGKGKAVFVVSISGTAVKLDRPVVSPDADVHSVSFFKIRQQQLSLQLRQSCR